MSLVGDIKDTVFFSGEFGRWGREVNDDDLSVRRTSTDCLVQLYSGVHPHQLTFEPVLIDTHSPLSTDLSTCIQYYHISTAMRSASSSTFLSIHTGNLRHRHQQVTFQSVQIYLSSSSYLLTCPAIHRAFCIFIHLSTTDNNLPNQNADPSRILINFFIQVNWSPTWQLHVVVLSPTKRSSSQLKRTVYCQRLIQTHDHVDIALS